MHANLVAGGTVVVPSRDMPWVVVPPWVSYIKERTGGEYDLWTRDAILKWRTVGLKDVKLTFVTVKRP
jgi:hypothetical protein